MVIRGVLIDLDLPASGAGQIAAAVDAIEQADPQLIIGVAARSSGHVVPPSGARFVLPLDALGIDPSDRRVLAMAAAGARCHLRELVLVSDGRSGLHEAAAATGCRFVLVDELVLVDGVAADIGADLTIGSLGAAGTAIEQLRAAEAVAAAAVGVGPHAQPWPDDPRLDPELLAGGDRRNVVDRFRYWSESAIIDELDRTRLTVHVAVENWQHDLNIGTVVRNANAFNVAGVHIVGKRRWNRRGAMATDRYLSVTHHPSVESFVAWADGCALPVVGIDNVRGAVALEAAPVPTPCVLVFGQEGPGLSAAMLARCAEVREITQHGSTRSLNAGVASGIALHWWAQTRR